MERWVFRFRWPLVAGLTVLVLLAVVGTIFAQPPVPHAIMEGDDCLSCHQAGVGGAPRLAWDHVGRSNADCMHCHDVTGGLASDIPHTLVGRDDCLTCHDQGIGAAPAMSGNHVTYANDQCRVCHLLSPDAVEVLPGIPASPGSGTGHPGESSCVSCHQLIFADAEHAVFTGQPVGDVAAGASLFAQLCAVCHGEDGTVPVGDDGSVINAESYWSANDDAAILLDIAAGAQGQMTAFAQEYGGPLSWAEILDLATFLRSWGPVAIPTVPAGEAATYDGVIGPLLSERCGACHGGSAGLTVTDYASLMEGADSGPVVTSGDPDGSRIVQVQQGQHYAQLSETELATLISWIAAGAPNETP